MDVKDILAWSVIAVSIIVVISLIVINFRIRKIRKQMLEEEINNLEEIKETGIQEVDILDDSELSHLDNAIELDQSQSDSSEIKKERLIVELSEEEILKELKKPSKKHPRDNLSFEEQVESMRKPQIEEKPKIIVDYIETDESNLDDDKFLNEDDYIYIFELDKQTNKVVIRKKLLKK